MSISNFSGHMQSIKLNFSATVLTLGLRRLEIVFIFTGLVLQILLLYRISVKFTTDINETSQNQYIIFFPENLLP